MVDRDLGRGESPAVSTRAVILTTIGILAVLVAIAFGFEPIFRDRIAMTGVRESSFPAHWDPKLRIPRGQVVAAASIVSPKY